MKTSGVNHRTLTKKRVGRKPKKGIMSETTSDSGYDKGVINVNGMKIDIESITDEQLYALRKVLPRKEYRYLIDLLNFLRLLKNRKSARKSRKRRKAELTTLKEEIDALKKENDALKEKIKKYEGDDSSYEERKSTSFAS